MKPEHVTSIEREASHFFRVLFGGEAPQVIKARYRDAHLYMFSPALEKELETVQFIVTNRLDAEAAEAFLRRKDKPHVLTLKMQLLIYLVELHPSYYRLFISETDSRWAAVSTIIGALIRWPCLLTKGAYLTWRYKLV